MTFLDKNIIIIHNQYYERIDLIPEVPRNSSGMREYDGRTLRLTEFIMRLKQCGMKLDSIREYVHLAMQGEKTRELTTLLRQR